MDKDSFIVRIKKDYIYKDIAKDVETRFDSSNYELDRLLPKVKNKNVTGIMKDELGGKIMKTFVGLRAKAYSYLKDDGSEDKKAKSAKKCVIKRKLKFESYKNCLEAAQIENNINHLEKNNIYVDIHKDFVKKNKLILKTQQRYRSEKHYVFTEEINKIVFKFK